MHTTTTRPALRIFPMMMAAASVALLAVVCWSILTPLFLAAVVAGTLYPLTAKLARRLKGRKTPAAFVMTLAVALLVVGPLTTFITLAIGQAGRVGAELEEAQLNGRITAAIERMPAMAHSTATELTASIPSMAQLLKTGGTTVLGLITLTGKVLLDMGLGLIALFFLLLEGPQLLRWVEAILPVPNGQFRSLMGEFRRVSKSVLVATGATAAVQAITGLIGLLIAQVPNPIFFTFLTFFLALVPAIGAASCFVVLGVVYLLDGHTGTGAFLICWGLLVVGLADNLMKPLFIREGAAMHGALVFFSLVGGVAAFGAPGLVAGPLAVAFFIAVMNVTAARPISHAPGGDHVKRTLAGG